MPFRILLALGAAFIAITLTYDVPWCDILRCCDPKPFHARNPLCDWLGCCRSSEDWNILYHLAGVGPWVERIDDIVDGGIASPQGCRVEQVHMMSRHAARYPTVKDATKMIKLLKKMLHSNLTFKGDLAFVQEWEPFFNQTDLERLTTTGPFSGTLSSMITGVKLHSRYPHMLGGLRRLTSYHAKTKLWAADSASVIDTANYFGAGFFGFQWHPKANLVKLPEQAERGADSLTPSVSCLRYLQDTEFGYRQGAGMMKEYRATYLGPVRKRLLASNPDIEFSDDELGEMQRMCGFEITVRGNSSWCRVFTKDDFVAFEYAGDVLHYYAAGPGNPYASVVGFPWLNATKNLLVQGPSAGQFFFSFVHDTDLIAMLTALDLFPEADHLPTTHIARNRKWKLSQVVPMGGRIIFELLSCNISESTELQEFGQINVTSENSEQKEFLRINVNDGIVALPGCETGPGKSCPLSDFDTRIQKKGMEVGDFRDRCGLHKKVPDKVTFLQPQTYEETDWVG